MFTLISCLFIACLFPFLSKIVVGIAMKNQPGGYDNHQPRKQEALLTGWGARAVAAHQNSFESLIIFSTAILSALSTQTISYTVQTLAVVYVLSRVAYHFLYILDWATLRSCVWAVGFISSLSIIWSCIP